MKLIIPFVITLAIYFFSAIFLAPIISTIGYSEVEGSYHALTHALILALIFTVIVCTFVIKESMKEQKKD